MAILNGIIKKMTGSAGQQRQRMKWVLSFHLTNISATAD